MTSDAFPVSGHFGAPGRCFQFRNLLSLSPGLIRLLLFNVDIPAGAHENFDKKFGGGDF